MATSHPVPMPALAPNDVPFALVVTNPAIEDNPIVFVNSAFTQLTGYTFEQAVGRNCRFLQGPGTDPEDVATLRDAVMAGREVSLEILNYKADGAPFLNHVQITPLRDAHGAITSFVGIQRAVGAQAEATPSVELLETALSEVHHRVKNHLSMVVGLIRMQSRVANANSLENYATLARRIETLQLLYQEMTGTSGAWDKDPEVALGEYVARIASTVAYLDGRKAIRLDVEVEDIVAPIDTAAQLGLLASELVTNAYQHAFKSGRAGLVSVRLGRSPSGTIQLEVRDDGDGMPADLRWPDKGNLGGKIVRSLLTGLEAELAVTGGPDGTMLVVDVPGRPRHLACSASERGLAANSPPAA